MGKSEYGCCGIFIIKNVGSWYVVSDAHGQMVTARSIPITSSFSLREAKAINVRESLSWVKSKGIEKCIVEYDS